MIPLLRLICLLTLTLVLVGAPFDDSAAPLKPRLMVLTDIGGDPDDQQSLVRLMVYANEFEIEGLIATASGTPGELKKEITRPDLIQQTVRAYGQVLPNLKQHASGMARTRTALAAGQVRQSQARPRPRW